MAERGTRSEEQGYFRDALLAWRGWGVERPIVPVYYEGRRDAVFYGLDADDEPIVMDGMTIEDSVSVSTGRGIEGVGPDVAIRLP
ncbi:hypothetical protein GCM10009777_39380 [Microbacterium pumilum]|uniref:Uncharacterized protein n=1 Tax=Microbacterium pumilum TaxID=344165 RepID=A0ABN2T624_9MICO